MKIIFSVAVGLLLLVGCQEKYAGAKLKGQLNNFENETFLKDISTEGLLRGTEYLITLDSNNYFSFYLPLEKAGYFKLGRNTLYLSPGDDLDMVLDYNTAEIAFFNGIGAPYNDYLKHIPYPRSGSFVRQGLINDNPSLEVFVERADSLFLTKNEALQANEDLNSDFKRLERARLRYDIINSLMKYSTYIFQYRSFIDYEARKAYCNHADSVLKPVIEQLIGDHLSGDYLNLEVFIKVLPNLKMFIPEEQITPELSEYLIVRKCKNALRSNGLRKEVLEYKDEMSSTLQSKLYKSILDDLYSEYANLLPGKPAPDFTMVSKTGDTLKLSDFRNKCLLIDLWATWCGPCKRESKLFYDLADKYESDNLTFIALSIDKDQQKWLDTVEQYSHPTLQFITSYNELKDYHVTGVPRYICINKKGEIIDAFAPHPSSGELESLIKELSNKE